jgi:hypothetical protein
VIDAAGKLCVLGALGVRAGVLVGTVAAVVVAVAHPALLNTFAIGACKLVRAACFIWGNQTKAHNATHPLTKSCARCTHQTPSSLDCSLSSSPLALLSLILREEIVGQVVFTQSACQFAGMQPVEARRRAGRITFDPSLKEKMRASWRSRV